VLTLPCAPVQTLLFQQIKKTFHQKPDEIKGLFNFLNLLKTN